MPFQPFSKGVHGDVSQRALALAPALHVPVDAPDPLRLQERLHALVEAPGQQRVPLQLLPEVVEREPADEIDHSRRLRVVRRIRAEVARGVRRGGGGGAEGVASNPRGVQTRPGGDGSAMLVRRRVFPANTLLRADKAGQSGQFLLRQHGSEGFTRANERVPVHGVPVVLRLRGRLLRPSPGGGVAPLLFRLLVVVRGVAPAEYVPSQTTEEPAPPLLGPTLAHRVRQRVHQHRQRPGVHAAALELIPQASNLEPAKINRRATRADASPERRPSRRPALPPLLRLGALREVIAAGYPGHDASRAGRADDGPGHHRGIVVDVDVVFRIFPKAATLPAVALIPVQQVPSHARHHEVLVRALADRLL